MATIAAIMGVPLPDDAAEDSFNMLPALLGEPRNKPIREAIVHRAGTAALAIRQGDWKLILRRERRRRQQESNSGAPGQLYNLKNDPAEKDNLWDRYPDVVGRLTKLLERYKKQGHSRPMSG
jgi:arylsulfatase A-like enzyme